MKKTLSKILALILSLASLISIFSVLAFAADEEDKTIPEDTSGDAFEAAAHLLYNRTFEDGWDAFNNLSRAIGKHSVTIDYEVGDDQQYNYFMRFEHKLDKSKAQLTMDLASRNMVQRNGMFVTSLSIKADDACDLGTILGARIGQDSTETPLLVIKEYKLYAFSEYKTNYLASLADGDWYDIDFIFDWRNSDEPTIKVYLDGQLMVTNYVPSGTAGVVRLVLGWTEQPNYESKNGMGFCIDNLSVYQSPYLTGVRELGNSDNGIFVDRELEKTVPIYKNANEKTPEQIIDEALYMKLGVDSALVSGVKTDLACPPAMVDGNVMIPLEFVLEYLDYPYYRHSYSESGGTYDSYDVNLPSGMMTYITIGRDTAEVEGELIQLAVRPGRIGKHAVIAVEDVEKLFPGMDAMYDDMGLVIVYENVSGDPDATPITRAENLDTMLEKMKLFVFDISAETEEEDFIATGEDIYEAVNVNTEFAHPYIIANQETFTSLNGVFKSTDETALKGYLGSVLAKADAIYADMAEDDGTGYKGFKEGKKPENIYNNRTIDGDDATEDTDDGYNPKTKALYEVEEASAKLVELAFAYNVTLDPKYAELAIDIMEALGEWVHWGPGYFVNCATATANFAIAYDWLYNYIAATENGAETLAAFATTIYDKGVSQGVNSSKGEFCRFPRTSGYGDHYTTRTDSYNAISASGMIIGSLAIMNVEEYKTAACYLIGNNLRNLADYGLEQYAPDGSYIESVTYWALGTNALMKTIMSLESATGDDLGYKDAWGLGSTFYYACYIANGKGEAWGYHEDGFGTLVNADVLTVDTQMLNYAGKTFGDNKLIAIRQNQLEGGKEATIFDLLFYPDGTVDADATLELNYYMEGIDAFVSRSGWEKDDMFVGIMGGANSFNPYGNGDNDEVFGQIDTGNFIYENMGLKWIVDHGSENFDVLGYFGGYRYNYFRNNAEGNNVVYIPDLAYGQTAEGDGVMYETYIDPDGKGSYAIVDNSNAYGVYSIAARRGLLVMGETVVIQDEIARSVDAKAGSIGWVVNTYADVLIDRFSDNRVAYLSQVDEEGNTRYIRATLVSSNMDIQFELITSKDSNLLTGTWKYDPTQRPVGSLNRLVVRADNLLALTMSVVFEEVESPTDDKEVGYEWTNLVDWGILFTTTDSGETVPVYSSDTSAFKGAVTYAGVIYDEYVHLTTRFDEFYGYISHVRFILVDNDCYTYNRDGEEIYKPQGFDPQRDATEYFNDYLKYVAEYTEYRSVVLKSVTQINNLIGVLAGD